MPSSRTFEVDDRRAFKRMKTATKGERQPLTRNDLIPVKPKTENQKKVFDQWGATTAMALFGSAGTGKTFLALNLALWELLSCDNNYEKIVLVRSAIPTREIGFLPGTLEEKTSAYEDPYRMIVAELTNKDTAYDKFKDAGKIDFVTTSFLRGTTFNNCIVIFDEFQNATAHEIDTVITRLGIGSKLVLCGDTKQNDLNGKSGFTEISNILRAMPDDVSMIEFTSVDIVRSGFVRKYIEAKERMVN